jgi:hypothetical protein
MKMLWTVLGPLALALTLLPPVFYVSEIMNEATVKALMLGGCVLWFVAAPGFLSGGDK